MNIYHKVLELWPGHESWTYGRSNRRGHKNARVVFLVHDTSAQCHACTCIVSCIYFIQFRSYGPDTVYYMQLRHIVLLWCMHLRSFMNIFHKVLELWPGHESGTYGRTDGRTYGTDRGNT